MSHSANKKDPRIPNREKLPVWKGTAVLARLLRQSLLWLAVWLLPQEFWDLHQQRSAQAGPEFQPFAWLTLPGDAHHSHLWKLMKERQRKKNPGNGRQSYSSLPQPPRRPPWLFSVDDSGGDFSLLGRKATDSVGYAVKDRGISCFYTLAQGQPIPQTLGWLLPFRSSWLPEFTGCLCRFKWMSVMNHCFHNIICAKQRSGCRKLCSRGFFFISNILDF